MKSAKQAICNYSFSNPEAPFSDVIRFHPVEFWQFVDQILLDPFDTAIKILAAEDATLDLMVARYVLLVLLNIYQVANLINP